jgi:hypothetical protein
MKIEEEVMNRTLNCCMVAAVFALLAASSCKDRESAAAQKAAPAPPVARVALVQAGTMLTGALQNSIATDRSRVGDAVVLRTTTPVIVDGQTVVPAGSTVRGSVTHVRAAGRMKGAAELTLRFHELQTPEGQRHALTFDPIRSRVKGSGKETAAEIGGGAAVGGIIGGAVGGKDGALKGGAIGAAVGTGVAAATPGKQIVLPVGQLLRLRIAAPATIEVASR